MKRKKLLKNQNRMDEIPADIKMNMDYNFNKNEPFQGLGFNVTEIEVIDILGIPESRVRYDDSPGEYQQWYNYDNDTVSIIFHYENFELDYITYHTSCLYINGKNLFDLEKQEILEMMLLISYYSLENAFDESREEYDILYESYYFKDVGLTLWFEDDDLDDVCISAPEIASYTEN